MRPEAEGLLLEHWNYRKPIHRVASVAALA
jgi:hypothetical protein